MWNLLYRMLPCFKKVNDLGGVAVHIVGFMKTKKTKKNEI